MTSKLCLGFLPWVIFDIVCRSEGLGVTWAAIAALATAVAVTFVPIRKRPVKSLDYLAITMFLTLLAVVLIGGHGIFPDRYARPIMNFALGGALLFGSLIRPFTNSYTREYVTAKQMSSTKFHRVNRSIALCWATGILLIGFVQLLGAALSTPVSLTICDWLVPISLALFCGYLTERIWTDSFDESENVIGDLYGLFINPVSSKDQNPKSH